MAIPLLVLAGAALGILSRVEEVTGGLWLAISTDTTWVAAAFAAGALATSARRAAATAALLLTCANGAYYGWIAQTEPIPLAAAAGSPWRWLALGLLTGAVFGPLGRLWRRGPRGARTAAAAPLLAVLALDVLDRLAGTAILP